MHGFEDFPPSFALFDKIESLSEVKEHDNNIKIIPNLIVILSSRKRYITYRYKRSGVEKLEFKIFGIREDSKLINQKYALDGR